MACQDYIKRFQNAVDVVMHIAGSLSVYPQLVVLHFEKERILREIQQNRKQLA